MLSESNIGVESALDVCLLPGTASGEEWFLSITTPKFLFAEADVLISSDDQQLVDLRDVIAEFASSPFAPEGTLELAAVLEQWALSIRRKVEESGCARAKVRAGVAEASEAKAFDAAAVARVKSRGRAKKR